MARRGKKKELTYFERELLNNLLEMFRVLKVCYDRLPDKGGITPDCVRFDGFDGNDPYESKFNCYSGRMNSHGARMPWYKLLLERWQSSADKENLTREDIERITAPFPRPAKSW